MTNRCERLLQLMAEAGLDAAYITSPCNIHYLSGYRGEGALFVSRGCCAVITDFRYIEQAQREAPGFQVMRTSADLKAAQILRGLTDELGPSKLAFEPDVMTVAEHGSLQEALGQLELVPIGRLPERMRMVKDADEISAINEAAAIACAAFEELLGWVSPGMTERQIQRRLDYRMLEMGAEALAFDTIAAGGPNGSLPHAVPGDRPLRKGELLTLDFGAQIRGYKCDMTRTIAIGPVSDELRDIYSAVLKAQLMALDAIAPGVSCKAVDAVARDYLDGLYPGAFGHSLGHGVGLQVHEGPGFSTRSEDSLVPGHVMTVEPGIYIEGLGGCRIEDMAIITPSGYLNPITAPKTLITV